MCGGPSSQQEQIAGQQKDFYSTLQNAMNENFKGQTAILDSMRTSFGAIFDRGINQYGYSPQEDAAYRTQASTGVANNYKMAQQATREGIAAHGGGNEFLPTGAAAQLTQQNALAAARQQSAEQLGITMTGYQQGRNNYLAAANELGNVSAQLNPMGWASQATGAGNEAYGSATQNAQQSAQMWEAIGGAVGGVASTALGAYMGKVGAKPGGGGGGYGGGGDLSGSN